VLKNIFASFFTFVNFVGIEGKFSKQNESRLLWKIASKTIMQLYRFAKFSAFLQDCFKGAANRASIFPSVLSCYRRIHQNWKTHLHYGSCAAHRGFTLNPVRKRSARSSISRVRQDRRICSAGCSWDAVNFLRVKRKVFLPPALSLSLFQMQLERWHVVRIFWNFLSLSLFLS